MRQAIVAGNSGVAQRRIFLAPERKHRLIHLLRVEHLEPHQQVKVLNRQPGDCDKQFGLQLADNVLQGVFSKVRQVHKRWNARRKLDQLFLHQLALGLVFFLLVR